MEASSKAARANLLHRHLQLKLQVGAPELAARLTRRSKSCKQIHHAAMLTPIQEASLAYLHGSNSKEENNLSSNKEKLFSSFLVSRVSSLELFPLTRRKSSIIQRGLQSPALYSREQSCKQIHYAVMLTLIQEVSPVYLHRSKFKGSPRQPPSLSSP
ncbi:hypothetical protein V7068_11745 [Bacillus sp. JJ634]